MQHKAPEFIYQEMPQLDELQLELPYQAVNTRLLTELALKNIMLIQQTLGQSNMTERTLPTRNIRQLDTIRLISSGHSFAVTAISQCSRLGKATRAEVQHYLFYADPTLAHLAQVSFIIPNPLPNKNKLISGLGTVNMQRLMEPSDHAAVEELILKVRR